MTMVGPKENLVRVLLMIAFAHVSFIAYSQKTFTGTYFTSKKDIGFESDIFQLEKDGSFRYIFFTCTGIGIGKGKYEIIKGDSLRLHFIDCEACDKTKEIETGFDSGSNIGIDLKVLSWEDNSAIAGVNVFFLSSTIGTVTDQNGNAQFTTTKFPDKKVLRIQCIGYDPVDIEVQVDQSKVKGVVRLAYHWVYTRSNVKTFKIMSWTNAKLKLRRYPHLTITYDKVKTSKTDQLIENKMGESGFKLYKEKICDLSYTNRRD